MEGKVVLITGASSGIGRATAELFAARGAKLVLAARRQHELATLARSIAARNGKASFIVADVAKAADVERMVAYAIEQHARLDYAVNNAGIEGEFASITELSEEAWDRALGINLKGVFLSLKYEARAMLAGGHGGAIVNIGSVNSFLGIAGGSAYVSSKHALIGLTSCASAELAPQGIRVNLLCPGIIDTPMHRRGRLLFGNKAYDTMLEKQVHLRRAGQPEEIARAIAFLCSEEASYITGSTLTPDGGYTLTM